MLHLIKKDMMLGTTWEARIGAVGGAILRYSLVFFFLVFGAFKFTLKEAQGIQPMTEHSVGLFWVNPLLGVQSGSNLIGVIEISIALLIATRHWAPRISMWGSLGAAFALINTISFAFTTPGLDPQGSDMGFLLKDITLLGAALWSAAEAAAAARMPSGNAGATSTGSLGAR